MNRLWQAARRQSVLQLWGMFVVYGAVVVLVVDANPGTDNKFGTPVIAPIVVLIMRGLLPAGVALWLYGTWREWKQLG